MIPKEVVDAILARADIVDVISSYINVEKKGNAYKAVCPFHADTNPSLHISKQKQIYKCFACDKGGNAFTFVSDYENVSYPEAIKRVASLISFDDPSLHEERTTFTNSNQKAIDALNDIKDFYHYASKTNIGVDAQNYFKERNIDEEMQDYFSLGFSPSNSSLLIKAMEGKKHEVKTLDDAGITIRENGNIVDRLNGRVIFPIFDEFSNAIGFSGRKIQGEGAKYVNTSSTLLFNKSDALYNYHNAKKEARICKYVYVVEGFMDVFALYKVNHRSCVALMGTAFTEGHAKMLRKLNAEIRLMLDGDEPGQNAMVKIASILEKEKMNFKIVDYKGSTLDPDEIYQTLGKDKLLEMTNNLIDANTFLIRRAKLGLDMNSIEGKKAFVFKLLPRVSYYDTKLEKEEYLKLLSNEANISYDALVDLVKRMIKPQENKPQVDVPRITKPFVNTSDKKQNLLIIEQELIYHILNEENAIKLFLKNSNDHFYDDLYGALFNYILDDYQQNRQINPASLINKLKEDEIKNKHLIDELTNLSLLGEDVFPPYSDELFEELIIALKKAVRKKEKQDDNSSTLKKANSPSEAARAIQKKRGI